MNQQYITDHIGNTFSTVKEMCKHYNISINAYRHRQKRGWSLEKTLTTPIQQNNNNNNNNNKANKKTKDHLGNEFPSIDAMCKHYGINPTTYCHRIYKFNWSLEKTLTTKSKRGTNKQPIHDHIGNLFPSIATMCRHYGITPQQYNNRVIKLKWSLEKTLTTPIPTLKTQKREHIDPFGNKFKTLKEMVKTYNIDEAVCRHRLVNRYSTIEALGIIPLINKQTKNTTITPTLHIIKNITSRLFHVIYNNMEIVLFKNEIIDIATEHFRPQYTPTTQ